MGRWFAKGSGRREKTVLATKLYGEMDPWPNNKGVSALNIRRACDASLKRMQTDYIDLYQMHHIDRTTPWEEVWQAMEILVAQGKILYVGSSNFGGWHLAQAQGAAAPRNFMGLVSEQSIYNLVVRDIEREVIPAAQHYGIGILPWSPLNGGLLGGVLKKERDGKRRLEGRSKDALDAVRPRVEAYENFCAEIGQEPGDVALAWLLAQPSVTAPIIGPRTQDQLDSALRALDVDLTAAHLTKLNEIDGYSYDKTIDYDGDGNGDVVIPTYGIIAQEIETILPNAVTTNTIDGIKGVDYNAVTGMLLSAVKKLYLKVVELENRISGSI
jgi:aryl-alcohol dehydrogenase-like predicted oxidoreductase